MATNNMRYDHPQYVVKVGASGIIHTDGAATLPTHNVLMPAFADMLVQAVHFVPIVGGTNTAATSVGHMLAVHVRNGTGVTGGTSTLIAAGDYGTGLTGTSVLTTGISLTKGDALRILNTGTDDVFHMGVTIEGKLTPGASVTS